MLGEWGKTIAYWQTTWQAELWSLQGVSPSGRAIDCVCFSKADPETPKTNTVMTQQQIPYGQSLVQIWIISDELKLNETHASPYITKEEVIKHLLFFFDKLRFRRETLIIAEFLKCVDISNTRSFIRKTSAPDK